MKIMHFLLELKVEFVLKVNCIKSGCRENISSDIFANKAAFDNFIVISLKAE